MSSKFILDAYAWIEYILGTKKGLAVRSILLDKSNRIFTMESNLAEIKEWCVRQEYDFNIIFPKIRQVSLIVPVILDDWLRAAEIKTDRRKKMKDFGLIDAVLLAYQEKARATIVTGDPHFKGIDNVKLL